MSFDIPCGYCMPSNNYMTSLTCNFSLLVLLSFAGQLSMEDVPTMVLCKPKLLPLKSVTLEKLEKMQLDAQEAIKQQELARKDREPQ
uniref:BBSome-interacting protein 1 n=1 Tax=Esox lucius TaxID=8010 RepID=A0AAY5KMK1_ESOLU